MTSKSSFNPVTSSIASSGQIPASSEQDHDETATNELATSELNNTPASKPEHSETNNTEYGGRKGPDPTRYGDWEKNGRCIDF